MATAVSLLIVSSLAMAMCRRPYQVLQDDKYSFQIKRLVTQGERKENSHA
jgi:hypothetical protein